MDESLYLMYAKDTARLRRELESVENSSLIAIYEIQRVPELLNMIQVFLDEGSKHKFLLTGSSARKLKRGHANLLPGRIVIEHLTPLSFWELKNEFDLEKSLKLGALPGVYLENDVATAESVLRSMARPI